MAVSAPRALDTPAERVDATIAKAIDWLDREQTPEGFWVGMLESNYCMEAEWLLAMHFLGYRHPRQQDLVATLLKAQRPDGSWEAYYDAPQGDINGTVECYAALRCVGMSADDEPLVRARRWIFEHGGLRGIRVFTRYWLALLGEWPWRDTPNLPPEVIANPRHGSCSISTTSRAGRAQPCCRSRCCRRAAPCGHSRPGGGSTSCSPRAASAWTTACRAAARGSRGGECSCSPTAFCISISSSASHRSARQRSTPVSAGSCATRTLTAPGEAFSRRGSTASWRSTSKVTSSRIP